jgi:hypothetical protein
MELLDDDQVIDFIIHGWIALRPPIDPATHAAVVDQIERVGIRGPDYASDPTGDGWLDRIPAMRQVFGHPQFLGAADSLLGPGWRMTLAICHRIGPRQGWHQWHQDNVNVRHHQVRSLTAMYYPHDVARDQGPTVVLPGSHHRNLPTERMQSYGNFRSQVALAVPAGTLAVTHHDLWHTATRNRTDRPRLMIKLYLERMTEPSGPTWNHAGAAAMTRARERFNNERTAECSQSDHYSVRYLRWAMWLNLLGLPPDPLERRYPGNGLAPREPVAAPPAPDNAAERVRTMAHCGHPVTSTIAGGGVR